MYPMVVSCFDSALVVEFRSIDLNYIQNVVFWHSFSYIHVQTFASIVAKKIDFFFLISQSITLISADNMILSQMSKAEGFLLEGLEAVE